jgi:hypothetical protein
MARPYMPENGSGGTAPLYPWALLILLRVENAHIAEESPQGLVLCLTLQLHSHTLLSTRRRRTCVLPVSIILPLQTLQVN